MRRLRPLQLLLGSLLPLGLVRADSPQAFDGVYFGSFERDGGQWALVSEATRGFHFVGFLPQQRRLIEGMPYWWDIIEEPPGALSPAGGPGHFWDFGPYGYEGKISTTGRVTGTAALTEPALPTIGVYGPPPFADLAFSGARDAPDRPDAFTGSFVWQDERPSLFTRRAYAFVGPSRKAVLFVQDADQGGADCGIGVIDDDGTLGLTFAFGTRVTARIDRSSRQLKVEFPPAAVQPRPAVLPSARIANLSIRTPPSPALRVMASLQVRQATLTLVRGIGPGLRAFLPPASLMEDPRLMVYGAAGELLGSNDDWANGPPLQAAMAAAGAFPLETGSKDAGLLFSPDGRTTIELAGKTSGETLLEVFALDRGVDAGFVHLAVQHHDPSIPLIAGLTIEGLGAKRLLIRGLGPALSRAPFNLVPGRQATPTTGNPTLALRDASGRVVAANADWDAPLAPVFRAVAASELEEGSQDAALLVTLRAGAYTVLLHPNGFRPAGVLLQIFEVE